jgi:murein DD-endopeptidase MepM/ murein hydrolase activator NlpD
MPAQLVAMMNSVRRSRANNTKALVAALAPLAQYGLDPTKEAIVGFGRFPVAGTAVWSDDWWLQRCGPGWRLHEGVDIFAAMGTPVRAPVDGAVHIGNGGLGGLSVRVTQPNRTYWYMAHLSGIAPGIVEGSQVRTGDVVGFVGNSGDAAGGPTHLHFEIHPGGGPAIPPKPVIDKFVADALARVPALLDAYAKAYAAGTQTTQPQLALPDPDLTSLTPRDAMLWASAVNPASGTFKIVEADAQDALASIDWNAEAAARADEAMEHQRARAWVLPLVPFQLARLLD